MCSYKWLFFNPCCELVPEELLASSSWASIVQLAAATHWAQLSRSQQLEAWRLMEGLVCLLDASGTALLLNTSACMCHARGCLMHVTITVLHLLHGPALYLKHLPPLQCMHCEPSLPCTASLHGASHHASMCPLQLSAGVGCQKSLCVVLGCWNGC